MRPARLLAVAVAAAASLPASVGFAVVGYVPDYRMDFMDWEQAVTLTTHLVLFSLEPRADAGLDGVGRIQALLQPGTALGQAISQAKNPAKVLVTLGGGGRSQHFPKVAGNKKARKKLVQAITTLFEELPALAGLDLDWEAPTTAAQWRDYGKLAQDLRTSWEESTRLAEREGGLLLTMTYHPGTGAVAAFANLKGKKSEKAFVDLFDFCHAMAYSHFDSERRHSTDGMDKAAVEEWNKYSLPLNRLTLGMPLFGVSRKTGETLSYADIMSRDPSLEKRPEVDECTEGNVYFVNAGSMAQKVQYAGRQGLAGVMVWELGQDERVPAPGGMLRLISRTAEEIRASWRYRFSWLPFGENHVIMVFSALAGLYLLREVVTGVPPAHKLARQRPPPSEGRPTDGNAAAAPSAAPAEEPVTAASEGERG